ncbi:hypothetical protein Aca07nite_76550 [Actinoplanes capillaceus]|uniref:Uncharacterized protein n=1 Tax=Actinoplanes campanulatus TaxID=113559 RepID=A0ABQ3WVQ2_9ACTN|nr:hypothetical protein Aca07nite_76550 [Actinoplanes capillaceus]
MLVPSLDLVALPGALFRPLTVAVAHIPILVVVCFATPVWVMAVMHPATHGDLGLKLLRELRTWSRDVIGATGGTRRR